MCADDFAPVATLAGEARVAFILAQMRVVLEPHQGSLRAMWDAMPAAFLAAHGREVDKESDHDLMMCHAALAAFDANMERWASEEDARSCE